MNRITHSLCGLCRTHPTSAALLALVAVTTGPPGASAHEGHAALPSTGAKVEGNLVLVSERARRAIGLETAKVTLDGLRRVLAVRARVELPWEGRAMVTTLAAGRIHAVLVEPGQAVEAGQPLARVESLELETLQLDMLQAARDVKLAERFVEQRRTLRDAGAIAGESLLDAETELRQKLIELETARRKLQALGFSTADLAEVLDSGEALAFLTVSSPISGLVEHVDVRVGQFVDTEDHLFSIVNPSRLLVIGEVLETDAWQVSAGIPADATFAALPGESLAGHVERLRLHVDPTRRTLDVVMPVENRDGLLRPGMSGRLALRVAELEDAIVCPAAALIDTPDRTFVLLRRGEGKYERRAVDIGLRTPDHVEIRRGLFPGDQVVVTGTKLLASMFHTERRRPLAHAAGGSVSGTGAASKSAGDQGAGPLVRGVVELRPGRKAFATPVIAGRIARIHVEPGATARAGQVLAELDSQELRTLEMQLLTTGEQLRAGRATLERLESAAAGAIPQTELWQQERDVNALEQTLHTLVRKLSMAGLAPDDVKRIQQAGAAGLSQQSWEFSTVPVRAPAGGILADFDVSLGQIVHADDVLFEIHDLDRVWIESYLSEAHAARIQPGQKARVRIAAFPELELTGRVVRTAATLRATSRVLPVWIELANPGHELREGLLATIEFEASPGPDDLTEGQ
ncbi:MAG TPA: efflux RND transporter periplasmic adaptor subunit [Planctomycetaceae bacterium]|nr:efflux RND transporter periplasmic adaptor subunit [Planctomycetaceae bacterium]